MIKVIIHASDIHIRKATRYEEYSELLSQFIEQCSNIASNYERDEVRIVLSGDLFHSKNEISNTLIAFTSTFLRQLEQIANVLVISGNHDLIVGNTSKKDSMTALFETAQFTNCTFLDMALGFDSGIIEDDNVAWALYSIYTGFRAPDVAQYKITNPDKTILGLFHGSVIGSTLNNGMIMESGVDKQLFEGCDYILAGDIHKRQEIKCGDALLVYPGSIIQQTFGETLTQHGFCVWDLEKNTHEYVDLESDYGLYDFTIEKPEDIDEDKELLKNY